MTCAVTVMFDEDQQKRSIARKKSWKVRSAEGDDLDFDTIEKGHPGPVFAYWSPMKTFYKATVIAVPSGKMHAGAKLKPQLYSLVIL